MCASQVYKRRKSRHTVTQLLVENGQGSTISVSGNPVSVIPSQVDSTRERKLPSQVDCTGERKLYDVQKPTVDHNSANDSCSSSKSNVEQGLALTKAEIEDAGECSSSETLVLDPSKDIASVKELCISVLGIHGQLGGDLPSGACALLDLLVEEDTKLSVTCKVCGVLGNSREMLICDLCDEAFHQPCCKVKKQLPFDDWFCPPCFRKKPKVLPETVSGKLFNMMGEEHRKRLLQGQMGPISLMLKDTSPYSTGVRIGQDFQAEVPNWSAPISENYDCLSEPIKLDPAECDCLNGIFNKSSRTSSIGNWLQCREVVYNEKDDSDEGVVCGKWRRAPLFASQTEDWDCSCSVLWDPFHADCAVPQELETCEVLKQLKYVQLLKPRLAKRKPKPGQTKRRGSEQE